MWTFILFFRDFSWISNRTNIWDAIGVGSYGLLIALIESITITLAMLLLGLLVSKEWDGNYRVVLLGVIVFIIECWAILSQLFFLTEMKLPKNWIQSLAMNPHPLWILYGLTLPLVLISIVIPISLIMNLKKFNTSIYKIIESMTTLSTLYLILDAVGIIIIIVRNV